MYLIFCKLTASTFDALIQHVCFIFNISIYFFSTNKCTICVVAIPIQHTAETHRAESSAVKRSNQQEQKKKKLTAFNQLTCPPSPVDNNSRMMSHQFAANN